MRIGSGIINIIFMVFLGMCAVFDLKKREIPIALILSGGIVAIGINICQMFHGEISGAVIVTSLIPGLFFLMLSFCTREKVGYGDGAILLVSGLVLGVYRCFLGLCFSLFLSSICALLLLLMRKVGKNSGLPFVPFLTIGMGVSFFV